MEDVSSSPLRRRSRSGKRPLPPPSSHLSSDPRDILADEDRYDRRLSINLPIPTLALPPALSSSSNLDRSTWLRDALAVHNDIAELRQRLSPLHRAVSFGHIYNVGRREVKRRLSTDVILSIVHQHFRTCGFEKSRLALEAETGSSFRKIKATEDLGCSRLLYFLRAAVRDTERIWECSIGHKHISEKASEDALDDKLEELGIALSDENQTTNVDIWQEPEKGTLLYESRTKEQEAISALDDSSSRLILAGSLNRLVAELTSETRSNVNFVKTFLMTYQSFTTTELLLAKLIERFKVPANAADKDWIVTKRNPVQMHVAKVIRKWVEEQPDEFRSDEHILDTLIKFVDTRICNSNTPALEKVGHAIKRALASGRVGPRVQACFKEAPPEPRVPKNIFTHKLEFVNLDELEIARQLTYADFAVYSRIKPHELLNQAWSKAKLKKRSANVLQMIARFNHVGALAASTIIQCQRLKARARMYEKWIKIAQHVYKLNNFNTLMAIIAGLNSSAVTRLKHTMEECAKTIDAIREMEQLLSNQASFRLYREHLANIEPPCIPYLGVYLTDLTFIHEGNTDQYEGLINFSKRRMCFDVISKIQQYQQTSYNLVPVHQIDAHLSNHPTLEDSVLYADSLLREPRGALRAEIEI